MNILTHGHSVELRNASNGKIIEKWSAINAAWDKAGHTCGRSLEPGAAITWHVSRTMACKACAKAGAKRAAKSATGYAYLPQAVTYVPSVLRLLDYIDNKEEAERIHALMIARAEAPSTY